MYASPPIYDLPLIRRLEAVSFRSWPAGSVHYDGTWAIRLTENHPSKRINSVNPMDQADRRDLERRVARMARRFEGFGRPLIFRQSPLAPMELNQLFDAQGWKEFDETQVMMLSLNDYDFSKAVQQVPLQDRERWINQCIAMQSFSTSVKLGLRELISLVQGEVGLFLIEDNEGAPLAAVMAVRFADMVGVFELVSHYDQRGLGYGRRILQACLAWGHKHGAQTAWLQVVSKNSVAIDLYKSEGFREVYRYTYRQAPQGFHG